MATTYDRLRVDRSAPRKISSFLSKCQVININSVVEFCHDLGKELFESRDFPNVAPPFKEMFFDWKRGDRNYGFLFNSTSNPAMLIAAKEKGYVDAKWVCSANLVFYERNKTLYMPDVNFWLIVNSNGSIASTHNHVGAYDTSFIIDGVNEARGELEITFSYFTYVLFALSLMNCRNVELVDNIPPAKLSKRHQKERGVPLVTYKTLKITPMGRRYESSGNGDGSKPSFHIMRGHFKDYRNGGGLFGKLNGVYWWESTVRGSKERGEVHKTYDVVPE